MVGSQQSLCARPHVFLADPTIGDEVFNLRFDMLVALLHSSALYCPVCWSSIHIPAGIMRPVSRGRGGGGARGAQWCQFAPHQTRCVILVKHSPHLIPCILTHCRQFEQEKEQLQVRVEVTKKKFAKANGTEPLFKASQKLRQEIENERELEDRMNEQLVRPQSHSPHTQSQRQRLERQAPKETRSRSRGAGKSQSPGRIGRGAAEDGLLFQAGRLA